MPAPAVAIVQQGSILVSAPATAIVQQQGALSVPAPAARSHKGAADYLIILSLILLLTLEPLYADHLLQLREPKTVERLGEDVRELSTSFDELDDDLPSIDTVPEEVKLDVDVLALVVENRILREGDGGLVVHHQCWWVSIQTGQLAQQPAQPHSLTRRCGRLHVLCLTCGQRAPPSVSATTMRLEPTRGRRACLHRRTQ